MHKKNVKRSRGDKIFDFANTFFMIVFAFLCIYPFYYIIINSVSNNHLAEMGRVVWRVVDFHLENVKSVVQIPGLGRALGISVVRTVLGTIISCCSSMILGYSMSRKELWGRKIWYRMIVITMYFSAGLIPTYLVYSKLGLVNNPLIYIIGSFTPAYNMILCKTYIENGIPDSLEEAAIIDGGGYLVRIFKIVFPLSKPIIATIALFDAVGHWNSYMDYVIYFTGTKWETLQALLYTYLKRADLLKAIMKSTQSMNLMEQMETALNSTVANYAITVINVVPVLIVYPFFQKYFTQGIMIGAVKG